MPFGPFRLDLPDLGLRIVQLRHDQPRDRARQFWQCEIIGINRRDQLFDMARSLRRDDPELGQLRAALIRDGGANIMIVVGGVIPRQDFEALREAGVAAIFPPGTAIPEAAVRLIEELNDRLGYRQKPGAE